MKLIALAAALALTGTAAIAQEAPATTPAPADTAAPATTPAPTDTAAAPTAGEDPAGGYQPSTPALSGQPAPGQQVIFQASKSPTEAYPPPAPMQSYPICKRGQFDNCRQRGG